MLEEIEWPQDNQNNIRFVISGFPTFKLIQ